RKGVELRQADGEGDRRPAPDALGPGGGVRTPPAEGGTAGGERRLRAGADRRRHAGAARRWPVEVLQEILRQAGGDEGAAAGAALDIALAGELVERRQHGVARDAQLRGERPARRQPAAGAEPPLQDGPAQGLV